MNLRDGDLFWEYTSYGIMNVYLDFHKNLYINVQNWLYDAELTWSEALVVLQTSSLGHKFDTMQELKRTVKAVGPYFHIDRECMSISNTALKQYLEKGEVPPVDTFNPLVSIPTWKECFGRIPKDVLLWGVSQINIEKVKQDGTFKIYQKAAKENRGMNTRCLWDCVAVFGSSVLSMEVSQFTALESNPGWEDITLTPDEQRSCIKASNPAFWQSGIQKQTVGASHRTK